MNTTTAVVTTGVIVAAGRWAGGQPLDIKIAIGVGVLAVVMAGLSGVNEDLASKFAVAVLLLACFRYVPVIVQKLGWTGAMQ
jgi:hypothetical protein